MNFNAAVSESQSTATASNQKVQKLKMSSLVASGAVIFEIDF